ncbi:MAG: phosphoribosylformylglycinamidine synthase subunit PurL [Chloroflexi bacterium]|nr:phosphoribosylformylglycinamidine synthase subunit PurL [Chloroflexota bacterium]
MDKTAAVLQQAFRVEVRARSPRPALHLVETARQLGIERLTACERLRLFFLQGTLTQQEVETVSAQLLADPVTETFRVLPAEHDLIDTTTRIEVTLLPGVTDPAAESLLRAAHSLGISALERAATGYAYLVQGDLSADELQRLAVEVFSNPVIQRHTLRAAIRLPFVAAAAASSEVERVALYYADAETLQRISKERRLSLDLAEMRAIQAYFRREGRDPSDAELETLAQTWSEHCVHKTFRALIDYHGPDGVQQIDGLLRTYIRAAAEKVNKPFVRSAFVDNAGIVAFDERFDLAFKVETHNHPSALEPFGGANTGVGGVVRDILGVSARPIANTDVLCFGLPDTPHEALPANVLHPRRIADGVVAGIEDYGNKMGIPTVNGAILYDKGYTANPLVFCGSLGILPRGAHPSGAHPGDLIVVIGGRTGRDGLRGATFSSMEMDTTTSAVAGSAVQIGHPIHEKQVLEVVLRARDEKLYRAITDCGAGGLSSAVGEMGAQTGARVALENVPLKYAGLRPWEIWLSEAQERMVLAVPPENWSRLQAICAGQDIEAVKIGTFEASGRLRLFYGETAVGNLAMSFLHNGIPQRRLKAVYAPPEQKPVRQIRDEDLTQTLLKLLAHPDVRSKEDVIRRYDHEVQGGGALKPLVGVDNHGPSDAAVLVPLDTQLGVSGELPTRGAALANGICPAYGTLDPYRMAYAAVDEAMRNLVAVGADPDQVAILDNFCWGNPNLPDRLGALVRCAQGCHDAALTYQTPFISGKDSLNNEYADADGTKHAIPGTLLISALGIVPDVTKTVTMDLKAAGNLLYVVGETRDEMGGSLYNRLHGLEGGTAPQPVPNALDTLRRLYQAIQAGLVQSCHDVSEGGIAVALAEMCIAGRVGAKIFLFTRAETQRSAVVDSFSESICRFVVEVAPGDKARFEKIFSGLMISAIGETATERLTIIQAGERVSLQTVIDVPVAELEKAWRGHMPYASSVPANSPLTRLSAAHSQASRIPAVHTGAPKVLILHATGTNRDREAALACQLAGGAAEIVHVNQLRAGERHLRDYAMLVLPGGFSYGDDLGAGTLWALDMQQRLGDEMHAFVASGKPVLGICNGFQALVKAGILPGSAGRAQRSVTLTYNESEQFECRWVYLRSNSRSQCIFTTGLEEQIYCPAAHGEGRVAVSTEAESQRLWAEGYVALSYVDADGNPAPAYPHNPNGSLLGIAGLTNRAGNVLGLMPHPEDHVFAWQHPRWQRGETGMRGLRLFQNALKRG